MMSTVTGIYHAFMTHQAFSPIKDEGMQKLSLWPQVAQGAKTKSDSRVCPSTTAPLPCLPFLLPPCPRLPRHAHGELQRPAGPHQSPMSGLSFLSPGASPGLSTSKVPRPGPHSGVRRVPADPDRAPPPSPDIPGGGGNSPVF